MLVTCPNCSKPVFVSAPVVSRGETGIPCTACQMAFNMEPGGAVRLALENQTADEESDRPTTQEVPEAATPADAADTSIPKPDVPVGADTDTSKESESVSDKIEDDTQATEEATTVAHPAQALDPIPIQDPPKTVRRPVTAPVLGTTVWPAFATEAPKPMAVKDKESGADPHPALGPPLPEPINTPKNISINIEATQDTSSVTDHAVLHDANEILRRFLGSVPIVIGSVFFIAAGFGIGALIFGGDEGDGGAPKQFVQQETRMITHVNPHPEEQPAPVSPIDIAGVQLKATKEAPVKVAHIKTKSRRFKKNRTRARYEKPTTLLEPQKVSKVQIKRVIADTNYQQGNRYLQQKKVTLAIEELKKAIATNPGHGLAYRSLGVAYYMMGREGDAIAAYRFFVRILPHHRDVPKVQRIIDAYTNKPGG